MRKIISREFPPEKVGPKLRRYMLAKEWDAIIAEDKEREAK